MKNTILKERFVELRAEGMSFSDIAKQLNISKGTAVSWGKELKHDVSELTETRLEAIKTKYKLSQSQQVERFGKWLKRIEKELSDRSFKNIRTEQLFTLAIKITDELRLCVDPQEKNGDDKRNIVTAEELEFMANQTTG